MEVEHAALSASGRVKYEAVTDSEALDAAFELCRIEGILPALESSHALAILKRINCKGKTIVVNLSGRGDKDLSTYMTVLETRSSHEQN